MPRPRRQDASKSDATIVTPPENAATSSTVNTSTQPNHASADAAQSKSGFTSGEMGANAIGDQVPSKMVTNDGDIKSTPTADSTAAIANSNQPQIDPNPPVSATRIQLLHPSVLRCSQCGAEFSSMALLSEHIRSEHRVGSSSLLTTPAINEAISSFLLVWENLRLLAPEVPTDALNQYMGESLAKAPLLIVEDKGLCTSFLPTDIISISGLEREIVGFTWFMEMLQMVPALPEGAINYIVCNTGWASHDSTPRGVEVRLSPPTEGSAASYTVVLSKGYIQDMQFNPLAFRSNALLLMLKFTLANLKLNKSTVMALDVTPRSAGRMIRTFDGDSKTLAVAYPGREVLPEATRNALFLQDALVERIGRIGRAQLVSGAASAHVDTYELCDTLSLAIRETYHDLLRAMHLNPTHVAQIIADVSQHLIATTIPVSLRDSILCPWFASTPTLQLQQVINLLNVANNSAAALPLIEAASSLIRAITPLRMDPTILTNAISNIPESTTQTLSPISEILRLLRPLGNDYSAFYRCLAGWLYSGLAQTVIANDAYPDPTQSITHIPSLWSAMLVMLASPMTTDPHAPVKAFMAMANLLAQHEPIAIDVPGMYQTTSATQFTHPGVWPAGFIQPNLLNRQRTPLLRALADLIHASWPQPGVIQYGSSRLGSANLFIPPNQLVYPWPVQPLPRLTVRPTYDTAMSNWINGVISYFINVVNSPIMASSVNDMTRRTIIGVMASMKQLKTMTPFYITHMCPTELAVIGGITVVPPFQVPFNRLLRDQIITNVMVSRVDPIMRGDAAVDPIVTMPTLANAVPVDPASIVVAMLCGTTEPTLIPSYHYARAITPLFLSDGIFTRNQRAVITREAFVCARSIIAQCTPDGFQVPRPLEDLPQFNSSGSTAAELLTSVNDLFKTAFKLDGSLLDGIGAYGDPRIADLSVALVRYNGDVERVHTAPDAGLIHDAFQLACNTYHNEPNLWATARGDVILAQHSVHDTWNPLNPVGLPMFDRNTPGVHIAGRNGMLVPQPGGLAPLIMDDQGVPQPIDGDWIYPISVLQVSMSAFKNDVWPMILAGRTRVRIEMGSFLFTIHYHEPTARHSESLMIESWFDNVNPRGIPPFPFSAPIPQIHVPITSRRVYFGYCTQNNNDSLFSTNAGAIQSVWGQDVQIDPARWSALMDPDYQLGTNELPTRVQLYAPLRRYNYEYPDLKGMVYMPGV
ncbi:VP3 [Hirame aquareovirus]|nr:VP3 [Hirame aquareovirus]